MIKDMKKLSLEELENVTGGTGETYDMEHMQEYLDEIMSQNNPLFQKYENPHSKKEKGKLIKK